MDEPNKFEHLESDHDGGFEGESASAAVESFFEGGAKKIDDHDVGVAVLADVVDGGDVDFFANFFGFGEIGDELGLI